ncbi:G-protein coupled receptor Mth2-like [Eupeodes corollae]|uniref:G-protein coupled receptor Mth2-like n=1 Tax=Eupeodes corollae TaxID=290404 RepID=UPI002491B588|nr:G-protein coupled receptor Mth2-like [Eupeodes corollae]XP_055913702.1 G-protein coupled receptor Mth2-like [Eupeodes corollae]XP_055913703.1 G-protein coupled receptor Mth2-like [Eupeodes corollae]
MAISRNFFTIGGVFVTFLQLSLTASTTQTPPLKEAPCAYNETVSLEYSERLENGSYLYDNIIVPAEKTGFYDYEIAIGNTKTPADVHVRGCVCELRTCISVCCPPDYEFHNGTCIESPFEIDPLIDITNKEGKTIKVNISRQFAIQYTRPCEGLFYFQPEIYDYDKYSIMENASIFKPVENYLYGKETYCLSPRILDGEFVYTPLQCYMPNPVDPDVVKLNGVALLISVPFMILTIIVYLYLPNLRTIHGLSLCCYLVGLSIGYLTLAYLIFEPNISQLNCSILGYTAYFGFMSAFFWLSVISYELYTNFHGSKTNKSMKQFRLYCLYAWGLSLICLISTYVAENSSIPKAWKSGIGGADYCFLNSTHGWSAFIYFYGPILLILSFNTVMFVLTFIQIRKDIRSYSGTHKSHYEHKDICMTFVRLFILMGITWLSEIVGYAMPLGNSWLHFIFRITDLLNGMQGVIIFVLFVWRKSVKDQIFNKFGKRDEIPCDISQEMTQCL